LASSGLGPLTGGGVTVVDIDQPPNLDFRFQISDFRFEEEPTTAFFKSEI
jgi:hypothetical protein